MTHFPALAIGCRCPACGHEFDADISLPVSVDVFGSGLRFSISAKALDSASRGFNLIACPQCGAAPVDPVAEMKPCPVTPLPPNDPTRPTGRPALSGGAVTKKS